MRIASTCRVCDCKLDLILSLGDLYISNFILPEESPGEKVPLNLMLCCNCWLVQLSHSVPTESLYRTYWYRSGTNATMRAALAEIAHTAETLIHLQGRDTVLDIGCNDGTLLASYSTANIYKTGFDPALNLAPISREIGDKIWVDFFNAKRFLDESKPEHRQVKIITSIAMFYDLDDPNQFVRDITKILHPDGLWIVQMSYLPLMLKQHEIGNICHEHLEYYSLQSFEFLLNRHGMEVVDVELNDVNGGSIRTYIRFRGANTERFGDVTYRTLASERVREMREQEQTMGLSDISTYHDFSFWLDRIKNDVVSYIRGEVARGKKVFVYGASTKGNTMLQYYGLDHTVVTAAADRNPDKWGRLTVGSAIPIVSEDQARAASPDYFLVLPWHFLDEFKSRESEFLKRGGRFILPAPYFTII